MPCTAIASSLLRADTRTNATICHNVLLSGGIVVGQDLDPKRLTLGERRLCLYVLQGVMVGEDLESRPEQVDLPRLQRSDNCKQLLLERWVFLFSRTGASRTGMALTSSDSSPAVAPLLP